MAIIITYTFLAIYNIMTTVHSQTIFNATISNSSGDWFIVDSSNTFESGQIICTSPELCHIECDYSYACQNSIIDCGSAKECIVSCSGNYACKKAKFYSNSASTSLTCNGQRSCYYFGIITVNVSDFQWSCGGGSWSCTYINYYDSSSYITADNFTWLCGSSSSSWACEKMYRLNISVHKFELSCTSGWGFSEIDDIDMRLTEYAYFSCTADDSCSDITNMQYPMVFETYCYGVASCNDFARSTVNATNETVNADYWYSTPDEIFVHFIMNCTHDILCEFNFDDLGSGRNIQIYCNDADECIVNCRGEGSCAAAEFNSGSGNMVLNCVNRDACVEAVVNNNNNVYPLSTVTVTCTGTFVCNRMGFTGGYSNFKIFCLDSFGGCDVYLYDPFLPTVTPDIVNATGEYYYGFGSYVNITCTHDLLCWIDCEGGSCKKSDIDCGDTNECNIECRGYGDQACEYISVTASDSYVFSLECTSGTWTCSHVAVTLHNISEVNIICDSSSFVCQYGVFAISIVQYLNVDCYSGSFPCISSTWDIRSIENATFLCGNNGCKKVMLNVYNTSNVDVLCDQSSSCKEFTISQLTTDDLGKMSIECTGLESCSLGNICAPQSTLRCCGTDACDDTVLCDEMDANKIDCACGTDACTGVILPSIPTTTADAITTTTAEAMTTTADAITTTAEVMTTTADVITTLPMSTTEVKTTSDVITTTKETTVEVGTTEERESTVTDSIDETERMVAETATTDDDSTKVSLIVDSDSGMDGYRLRKSSFLMLLFVLYVFCM